MVEVISMLSTTQRRDGLFEVTAPWRSDEQAYQRLEALIDAATLRGAVIRVCHTRDRNGSPRPAKAVLSVDPTTIEQEQ